jgi:hypothetical protein
MFSGVFNASSEMTPWGCTSRKSSPQEDASRRVANRKGMVAIFFIF